MEQENLKTTNKIEIITVSRARALFGFLILIGSPLITGLSAYYNAISSLKGDIASVRLEQEQSFVRKDVLLPMAIKLDRVAMDVAEIKGYLRPKKSYSLKPLDLSTASASR